MGFCLFAMADEEKGYTWETEYEKTWEAIREDDGGSLQSTVDELVLRAKRRKLLERPVNVKLGMMRHLFLVVDMSASMEDQDLRPSRLLSSLKLLEYLVEEYFDQNPISQLGIITTKNKRAEKVTELGGNPRMHLRQLQKLRDLKCGGEPSLQNALQLAVDTLKHLPGHASREVLVIFGSLTTCDPGDINDTIQLLKRHSVQCSMVGLAAEVRICKKLCQDTKGKYDVILDEPHFKDLLLQHVSPPPASSNTESSLIRMGFPHQLSDQPGHLKPSMCMCHSDSSSQKSLSSSGYFCPQCRSKYCELPTECKVCGLTLVSAPHLARSYHHLFPLEAFTEVALDEALPFHKDRVCFACQKTFKGEHAYQCTRCLKPFCVDCDLFTHETLHSCPGCASSRHTQLLVT